MVQFESKFGTQAATAALEQRRKEALSSQGVEDIDALVLKYRCACLTVHMAPCVKQPTERTKASKSPTWMWPCFCMKSGCILATMPPTCSMLNALSNRRDVISYFQCKTPQNGSDLGRSIRDSRRVTEGFCDLIHIQCFADIWMSGRAQMCRRCILRGCWETLRH